MSAPKRRKPRFHVGQVVRDNATNGRYAQVIGIDDVYVHLQADTYKYDVPIVNVRALTKREAGR